MLWTREYVPKIIDSTLSLFFRLTVSHLDARLSDVDRYAFALRGRGLDLLRFCGYGRTTLQKETVDEIQASPFANRNLVPEHLE